MFLCWVEMAVCVHLYARDNVKDIGFMQIESCMKRTQRSTDGTLLFCKQHMREQGLIPKVHHRLFSWCFFMTSSYTVFTHQQQGPV